MTDPTEAHDFTFGCYRAQHTPSIDAPEDDAATEETDPTPVTDGGPTRAISITGQTTCPACKNDLANVQGVPACTHCTWTAN